MEQSVSVLDQVTWKEDFDWWEGEFSHGDGRVEVYLRAPQEIEHAQLEAMTQPLDACLPKMDVLKLWIAGQLMSDHKMWADDLGQSPVDNNEAFAAKLRLVCVSITTEGVAAFEYHDGGLFGGHRIHLETSSTGEPRSAWM